MPGTGMVVAALVLVYHLGTVVLVVIRGQLCSLRTVLTSAWCETSICVTSQPGLASCWSLLAINAWPVLLL